VSVGVCQRVLSWSMALRITRNLRIQAMSGLGVLTISTQPQIKSSDDGIAANNCNRRHIQDAPNLGAAAPDTTTAAHASTVAVKWRQTHHCGDLLAV